MHRLQSFKPSYLNTSKRSTLFSLNQLIINQESILHTNMRLSLIFFGLSSVFAIVSSVPPGSIGLEKRQIGGTDIAAAAAPAAAV
ncbi:hypothetical protein G6F43_014170 [Rhizopus delemar]|nr:hypothetical protein G6F43_014170 [Rhizopus delemar]